MEQCHVPLEQLLAQALAIQQYAIVSHKVMVHNAITKIQHVQPTLYPHVQESLMLMFVLMSNVHTQLLVQLVLHQHVYLSPPQLHALMSEMMLLDQ